MFEKNRHSKRGTMRKFVKLFCYIMLCCVVSCIAALQVAVADSPSQKFDLNTQSLSPTAFTYQGQLRDESGPVNGTLDVRFTLYATQADGQALQSVEHEGLALTNGLFRLSLDFGSAVLKTGGSWLEIAVRAYGSADSYTVLTPRQKLTSTPYAIFAQAGSWNLVGVAVGFPDGVEIGSKTPEPVGTGADMSRDQIAKGINPVNGDMTPSEGSRVALAPLATPNFVAKFGPPNPFGAPTFLDSIMFDNGTNVGIGTTNPGSKLDVAGTAQLRGAAGGTGLFVNSSGNVGIRTTNPLRALQIGPSPDATFTLEPMDASPNAGYIRFGDKTGWKLHFGRSRESSLLNGAPLNTGTTGVLMTIQDNGNVGIGTTSPGFKLDVTGPIRAAGQVFPSDARLKNNVTPLTNALDQLEQIRGVSFEWNERSESLGHSRGQKDIGVIAQEVEAVFPELVNTSPTDGYKAVDYSRLTAVLIEAVKQLNATNQAVQAQSEQKDQEIQSLSARVATLEQLVQKFTQPQK
jgi:hypothetical protein